MPFFPGQDALGVHANIAALAMGGFVSFALITWDFITYLPDEIRLLKDFRKVSWRTPDPYAFIFVRYSSLTYGLISLFTLSLKTERCQLVASLTQVLAICALVPAGVLSARRMASLWTNHVVIVSISTILYVCMISSWIAVSTQYSGFTISQLRDFKGDPIEIPSFGTNCGIFLFVPWNFLNYIASTLFFGATFFLTLVRWSRQRTERVLNLGLTPLNRACLWYLMVSWLVSMVLLVVFASTAEWSSDIARRIASPFFILLIAGMAQRVFLNSQADYKLRKEHILEMANMKPRLPRWSWSPNGKKMSGSTISTGASPRVPLATFATGANGGSFERQTGYPRPPLPPSSRPTNLSANSPVLTPLPPQHILSIERSKGESAASSIEFKPSGSSHGHTSGIVAASTERLVASQTDRQRKGGDTSNSVRPPKSHDLYGASSSSDVAGSSFGLNHKISPPSSIPVSPTFSQSVTMSPSPSLHQTLGSPMSISTIGFSSPPGSPPVLSLPWPGGRSAPNSKKVLLGSAKPVGVKGSGSGRKHGSRVRTKNDSAAQSQDMRRISSMRSGWMN